MVEEVGGTQKNHCSAGTQTQSFVAFLPTSIDEFDSAASSTPSSSADDTLESLRSYGASLVATLPNAKGKSRVDATDKVQSSDGTESPITDGTVRNARRHGNRKGSEDSSTVEQDRELADEGGLTGCREAVELLTRNQKKGELMFSYYMI